MSPLSGICGSLRKVPVPERQCQGNALAKGGFRLGEVIPPWSPVNSIRLSLASMMRLPPPALPGGCSGLGTSLR